MCHGTLLTRSFPKKKTKLGLLGFLLETGPRASGLFTTLLPSVSVSREALTEAFGDESTTATQWRAVTSEEKRRLGKALRLETKERLAKVLNLIDRPLWRNA
jgi:hypothetical protein